MNSAQHFLKTWLQRIQQWVKHENAPYYIVMVLMLIVVILGINGFLELAEALADNELHPFDTQVQEAIVSYRDPTLTPTVRVITDLGDRYAYFAVIGIMTLLFLQKRKWRLALQILFVSGISAFATVVLKNTYERQRPTDIEHLVEIGGLSFPSGHSLSAMAFYSFCIYLAWRYLRSKSLRVTVTILCTLLILAIGISRIYLGVHYPSDVVAGFVGGIIWASFCILLFNLFGIWRRSHQKKKLKHE